jgi:hypothetical protein
MKIGKSDGSILFERGTVLRKQDRESFLATDLGRDATAKLVNKIWWRISIRPEQGIAATLVFKLNELDSVLLLMEIPADLSNGWTVKSELERKSVHDRWLRNEFGQPPYKFDWGVVASEFDGKGCVSEIIIAYET